MNEVFLYPNSYIAYMAIGKDHSNYSYFLKVKPSDEYEFEKYLVDNQIDYIFFKSTKFPCYIGFLSEDDLNIAKILY